MRVRAPGARAWPPSVIDPLWSNPRRLPMCWPSPPAWPRIPSTRPRRRSSTPCPRLVTWLVKIYNLKGELVKTLIDESGRGWHQPRHVGRHQPGRRQGQQRCLLLRSPRRRAGQGQQDGSGEVIWKTLSSGNTSAAKLSGSGPHGGRSSFFVLTGGVGGFACREASLGQA
jgi:hypothetical protein